MDISKHSHETRLYSLVPKLSLGGRGYIADLITVLGAPQWATTSTINVTLAILVQIHSPGIQYLINSNTPTAGVTKYCREPVKYSCYTVQVLSILFEMNITSAGRYGCIPGQGLNIESIEK